MLHAETQYLDGDRLRGFDSRSFANETPFPWWNPTGLLKQAAWERLRETLPDISLFENQFGVRRAHGQTSHDRFALRYSPGLAVAREWHEFVAELRSLEYRRFLHRAFGRRPLWVSYHWHYTPACCSVSPHCDSVRKLGSHIFYMNSGSDWAEHWGGQTLILDDGGKLRRSSAPAFEDFQRVVHTHMLGNSSLVFMRRGNSWHGVKELSCPEGVFRKIFVVVIESPALGVAHRALAVVKGKRFQAY